MSSSTSFSFVIAQQPSSRVALVGQAVADLFSVVVSSSSAVSYQWQHSVDGGATYYNVNPNGGVFTGALAGTLGVNPGMTDMTSVWNGAVFRCVVSSGGQTIISSGGTLTMVLQMPSSSSGSGAGLSSSSSGGGSVFAVDSSSSSVSGAGLSSSSSSESFVDINVFNFFEIRVKYIASSSSSSNNGSVFSFSDPISIQTLESSSSSGSNFELLTLLVEDPQLLSKMEVSSRGATSQFCFLVSHDEECPDGHFLKGLAGGCDPPLCDKVCCSSDPSVLDRMVCGMAYLGGKEYNTPWGFHLEPSSLRVDFRKDLSGSEIVGMVPSEIDAMLGEGLAEGSEFCFPLYDGARVMRVVGEDFCQEPLRVRAVRTFDAVLGEFVQQTSCEGDCEYIEGPWCVDSDVIPYVQQLKDELLEIEGRFASMNDEQNEQYFLDNIDEFLWGFESDDVESLFPEDFDEFLNVYLVESSSSSSDFAPALSEFDYREDEVSTSPLAPVQLDMPVGFTTVVSSIDEPVKENYFSFEVPEGGTLDVIKFLGWSSEAFTGTASLCSGDQWDPQYELGQSVVGLGLDGRVVPSAMPLSHGRYTLKVASLGSGIQYFLAMSVSDDTLLSIPSSLTSSSSSYDDMGVP